MNTPGERGPKGDSGDFQGERGASGERGVAGERGPQGDDGRSGQAGAAGADSHYLDRKKTLALFGFIVLAFVLLAYRTEVNSRDIQKAVYEVCIAKADVDKVTSNCERFR